MFIIVHRVCVCMRTESESNWIRFEMIWMEISGAPSSPLHHHLWIAFRHLGTYSTLNVTDRLRCTLHRYRHRYARAASVDRFTRNFILTKRRNFNSLAASHNKSISPAIHRSVCACAARTVTAEYKIIIIEFIIQAFIFWCLPHVHSISFHMFYRFTYHRSKGPRMAETKRKQHENDGLCGAYAYVQHFDETFRFVPPILSGLLLCSSYVVPACSETIPNKICYFEKKAQRSNKLRGDRTHTRTHSLYIQSHTKRINYHRRMRWVDARIQFTFSDERSRARVYVQISL